MSDRWEDRQTDSERVLLSSAFIIILISLLTLSFSPNWVTPQTMIEISPWLWGKIMILEDIRDIEFSICADSVSSHSSEAYFIFTVTLVMKWTMTRVWGWVQPEGFASEGHECFVKPHDYFSSASEILSRFLVETKLIVLWPESLWLHPTHKCSLTVLYWPRLRGKEHFWHEVLKLESDYGPPPPRIIQKESLTKEVCMYFSPKSL